MVYTYFYPSPVGQNTSGSFSSSDYSLSLLRRESKREGSGERYGGGGGAKRDRQTDRGREKETQTDRQRKTETDRVKH